MGIFSWLFGRKKKKASTDGQEKYFTDDAKRELSDKNADENKIEVGGKTLERVPDAVAEKVRKQAEAKVAAEEEAAKSKIVEWNDEKQAIEVKSDAPKVTRKRPAATEEGRPAVKPTEQAVAVEATVQIPTEEADKVDDGAKVLDSKATRSGKFEIKQAKDGRYFFCLYASNRSVIAFSQIYSAANSAINGIKSVMTNASGANVEDTTLKNPVSVPFPKWEIYIDKSGQYRFRLYATNGQCVCHSAHGYTTRATCKGGIDSIIRFAGEANIEKVYLNKE